MMSSCINKYYDIKDCDLNVNVDSASITWLNKNEFIHYVDNKFDVKPNENGGYYIVKSEFNSHIKLFHVKLNELINHQQQHSQQLQVLNIDNDQYYWSKLNHDDINMLPKHALRVGYDNEIKNFIYIGRLNVDNFNLIGIVSNMCEYVPANMIKFFNFNESYPNLNANIDNLNNQTTNYELLCIKVSPSTLTQLCIKEILKSDKLNMSVRKEINKLPNKFNNLIWPKRLYFNECLKKLNKLCSKNFLFEININNNGILKFNRYVKSQEIRLDSTHIYEKNIETFMLCKHGVLITFDSKQPNRRPIVLHEFNSKNTNSINIHQSYLKLTNNGLLKLVTYDIKMCVKKKHTLLNLNEYFTNKTSNSAMVPIQNVNNTRQVIESQNENNNFTTLYMPHAIKITTLNEFERYKYKLIKFLIIDDCSIRSIPLKLYNFFALIFKKIKRTVLRI